MSKNIFTLALTGLTALFSAVYILSITYFSLPKPSYDVYIIGVLYVITLLGYILIVKAKAWDQTYFMPIVLASIVVRLLIFAALNFAIIYSSPEEAVPNVVLFFTAYFLFTLLETVSIFYLIQKPLADTKTESK